MNKRILLLLIIAILAMNTIFGCTNQPAAVDEPTNEEQQEASLYPMTVTDGLGYELKIERQPQRLISLAPSQTEILYALGFGDMMVGVSEYCNYPQEALSKEKVGDALAYNIEKILELTPDLVFVYGEGIPDAVTQLEAAGITVVKYMPETMDEIFQTMMDIGKIMNEEAEAEALVNSMKERRDAVIAKVQGQPLRKVFYEVWHEPIMTAGPGSFIDELITLAGGENVAANADGAWPILSVEALIEGDPEVYIYPIYYLDSNNKTEEEAMMRDSIAARPGFGEINAIVNDRIEMVEANILSRPGSRIIEAFEIIAKAIHPEAFK